MTNTCAAGTPLHLFRFDAAGDNASGVASMIALAEHYSKIPRVERKRTMVFIGLDGHHNSAMDLQWATDGSSRTGTGCLPGRRWRLMWSIPQVAAEYVSTTGGAYVAARVVHPR